MDLHDIAQYGVIVSITAGLATIWFRVRQRDDRVADEARRQQHVEDRLRAIETRLEHHVARDVSLAEKIDKLIHEVHEVRNRLTRIETKLDAGAHV